MQILKRAKFVAVGFLLNLCLSANQAIAEPSAGRATVSTRLLPPPAPRQTGSVSVDEVWPLCFRSVALTADESQRKAGEAEGVDWRVHLKKVHARFTGRKGTFAHFGDSITDTMAFWTPLQYER